MLLTDEERKKFIEYLKNSIYSSELILEQFNKLSYGAILEMQEKMELDAMKIVLRKLESYELQTVEK